jgi:hypothetical protein
VNYLEDLTVTTATLTKSEQETVDQVAAARGMGVSLREYAESNGINVHGLYRRSSRLRLKTEKAKVTRADPFVAVPITRKTEEKRSGIVCRVVHRSGAVIECHQWPSREWIGAVLGHVAT